MTQIADLIEHHQRVVELIKDAGFANVILFKGFDDEEERNLNLMVHDNHTLESEPKAQSLRRKDLETALSKLLSCKVIVTIDERMKSFYKESLNETNSVALPLNENSSSYVEQLNKSFGSSWMFNPVEDPVSVWKVKKQKEQVNVQAKNKDNQNTPIDLNKAQVVIEKHHLGDLATYLASQITDIHQIEQIDVRSLIQALMQDVTNKVENKLSMTSTLQLTSPQQVI